METNDVLKKAPSSFMHLLEHKGKGIITISSIFFLVSRSSAAIVETKYLTDLQNRNSSDV